MLLLAVAVALGWLLPQAPPVTADALEQARWWAAVQARFGEAAPALRALGLLNVYHSPWFHSLLALGAFSLLVALANGVLTLWRQRNLPVRRPDSFYDTSPHRAHLTASPPLSAVLESVRALGERQRLRLRMEEGSGAIYLRGARFPWAVWGLIAVHLGLILLVAAFALTVRGHWLEEVSLMPGEAAAVAHVPGLTLRLETLDSPGEGEAGFATARYDLCRGWVVLQQGERVVQQGEVGWHHPLGLGLRVHLVGCGPALTVRGVDVNGEPLGLQTSVAEEPRQEAHFRFLAERAQRYFAIPDHNLAVRLVLYPSFPERGLRQPVFLVQVYRGSAVKPVFEGYLMAGQSVSLDEGELTFQPGAYATLRLVRDPGAWPFLLALPLLLGGLGVYLLFPSAVLWVLIAEEAGQVVVKLAGEGGRNFPGFARWFEKLARQIEEMGTAQVIALHVPSLEERGRGQERERE